jgi:predicted transcriptional regulator
MVLKFEVVASITSLLLKTAVEKIVDCTSTVKVPKFSLIGHLEAVGRAVAREDFPWVY